MALYNPHLIFDPGNKLPGYYFGHACDIITLKVTLPSSCPLFLSSCCLFTPDLRSYNSDSYRNSKVTINPSCFLFLVSLSLCLSLLASYHPSSLLNLPSNFPQDFGYILLKCGILWSTWLSNSLLQWQAHKSQVIGLSCMQIRKAILC